MTSTDPTVVVQTTAACTTSRHGLCRSVVYTLTTGLGSPLSACQCPCHEPAPIEDEELEQLLDLEADRRLDDERAWS